MGPKLGGILPEVSTGVHRRRRTTLVEKSLLCLLGRNAGHYKGTVRISFQRVPGGLVVLVKIIDKIVIIKIIISSLRGVFSCLFICRVFFQCLLTPISIIPVNEFSNKSPN